MELIKISDLQTLANFIHEESNTSIRNKLQAWIESKTANHEHADLSGLFAIADFSAIKGKISDWANEIMINHTDELISEPIKLEEDAVSIGKSAPLSVVEPPRDSEKMEQGISKPKEPSQKSKTTGKEKVKSKQKL